MTDPIPSKKGKYPCPTCAKGSGDKSLSVHRDATGGDELFFLCHRCGYTGKVGDSRDDGQPTAATRYFYYKDENGRMLFRKVRIGDGPGKKIWAERPTGGDWIKGIEGVRRELYNSDKLAQAQPGSMVLVHEGEPHCDRSAELGYLAVTNFEGAAKPEQKPKWLAQYTKQLAGFDVVLFPDNDDAGRARVEHIARSIHPTAKRVRICTLPGLPEKTETNSGGDFLDWWPDHIKAELDAQIEAAPEWKRITNSNGINAADLLDLDFPELKIIVAGLLCVGLFFLAGKPKLGKSWLMLQIALAVALGGKALGCISVEPGEVLYLALEDGRRRLQRRLKSLLHGSRIKPRKLHFFTEWKTLDSGGLEDLDDWLTDHPGTRLVVVDIFKRVRPRERSNVGAYSQDYDHTAPLQALALKHDVCLVLVHHTRKGESDDPLELLSGTNGLNGAADGTIILRRERGQADALLYVCGRDIEEQEFALQFDKALLTWAISGNASEARLSPERTAILRLLKASDRELQPKDIAETLNKRPGTVRKLLAGLSQQHFVFQPRSGFYLYNSNNGNESDNGSNGNNGNGVKGVALPVLPVLTEREERTF